ncbi:MAG: hypothetical protein JXR60_04480 [Bacteroidales bacterium]|nr:hypothetical protein [Bacteroidales bacterium]
MKSVLVLYYSQSGQLKNIVDAVAKPLLACDQVQVDFAKYQPKTDYPFPWSSDAFFDAFPESRFGITCPMQSMDIEANKHYDLIIFAYQVWYLSPSIPAWSALHDPTIMQIMRGRPVVTVLGVRNMWVQAHYSITQRLKVLGASHVGNLVLTDPANNLVSVITVIKWLIEGKQGPNGIWPRSGVPLARIEQSYKYGDLILNALKSENWASLQSNLVNAGAVDINFVLKTIETNGHRIFGVWAKMILKKGQAGDTNRLPLIRIFKYYLLFMIFILSPIASLVFWIINFLFFPFARKHIRNIALMH